MTSLGAKQRTRPQLCLQCGTLLDAASGVFEDGTPKAGDVSLCIHCGFVMVFAANGKFRKPRKAEAAEIDSDPRVQAARLAISLLKKSTNKPPTH